MIASSSIALVLLAGSALVASTASTATPPARRQGVQAAAAPATEPSTARGVIKLITGTRLVLEASPAEGAAEAAFALDDKTVVQRIGKGMTVRDLKIGDRVTVTYSRAGDTAVASRVWVRSSGGSDPPGGSGTSAPRSR